jgi:hypothetical protein
MIITILAPEVAESSGRFYEYLKLRAFLFHLKNNSIIYFSFLKLGVPLWFPS